MTDITEMQERIAHMQAAMDDLSDVVTRQAIEIDHLTRRVRLLLEREAEREAADGSGIALGDQRPPHY